MNLQGKNQAVLQGGGLSRRGFLAGAALAGVGMAAAGLGAGKVERAFADEGEAVEESVKPGRVGEDGSIIVETTDPIEPEGVPSSWDYETDVVVVGSGGGYFAALRALDLGADVILLEKNWTWGGSSKTADLFAVSGTRCQLEAGFPDMADAMAMGGANNQPRSLVGQKGQHPSRVDDMCVWISRNCRDASQWLEDNSDGAFEWEASHTGQKPSGGAVTIAPKGAEVDQQSARALTYVFEECDRQYAEKGGTIMYHSQVRTLVKDGDSVVGVKVRNLKDDSEFYVKASKGVLLATGGMCASRAMLQKYVPGAYRYCKFTGAQATDTGEGILMGLGAGGNLASWNAWCGVDGGIELPNNTWFHSQFYGDVTLLRLPWLWINVYGERIHYCQEDSTYNTYQANYLINQPNHQGYVIFDDDYEANAEKLDPTAIICRNLTEPTNGDVDRLDESWEGHDWRIGARQSIEDGRVATADTIEELAEKVGVVPETMVQAVEKWNAICEAGVDEEDNYLAEWLIPIKKPPYHCGKLSMYMYATTTGLNVSKYMQVLDAKGQPIPGLFASGCSTGTLSGGEGSAPGLASTPNGQAAYASGTAWIAANHMLDHDQQYEN